MHHKPNVKSRNKQWGTALGTELKLVMNNVKTMFETMLKQSLQHIFIKFYVFYEVPMIYSPPRRLSLSLWLELDAIQ